METVGAILMLVVGLVFVYIALDAIRQSKS